MILGLASRRLQRVALLVGLMLTPLAARAQTDAQKAEAKEHYAKATRLYEVGKYTEAIEEYQKVYLLVDDPNMIFNIAQCYKLTDRPEEALRFFKNFLRRAPNAPNRADVEKKIAELEKTIEDRKRVGAVAPVTPPAPVPTPAPVETAPPPPLLQPTAPGPAATAPPPMPAPLPGVPGVQQSGPTSEVRSGGGRGLAYALLISGAVLITGSIVSAVIASSSARTVEKATVFDPSVEKTGKVANGIMIGTGAAGLVAATTGVILLFTSGSSGPTPTASAPGSIAVFPLAGPGIAGAGARVTF